MRALLLLLGLSALPALADVPVINGTPVEDIGLSADPTELENFSTSGPGKVLVCVIANGSAVNTVSGAGLTFTQRAGSGLSPVIELWAADSAGAITNQTISVDFASAPAYVETAVWGVGTEDDFDTNAALPDEANTDTNGTLSTDADDSMGFWCDRGDGTGSVPMDWVEIFTGAFSQAYYQQFMTPQSGLTVPKPAGVTVNGRISDAIAGPVSGGGSTVSSALSGRLGEIVY